MWGKWWLVKSGWHFLGSRKAGSRGVNIDRQPIRHTPKSVVRWRFERCELSGIVNQGVDCRNINDTAMTWKR